MSTNLSEGTIYRSFFENHCDAVYILDVKGRFLDVNPAAIEMAGYSREEILQTTFANIVIPERLKDARRYFAISARGRSLSHDVWIVHKDGHRLAVNVTYTPIMIDGQVAAVLGVAKDVTEQKMVGRTLKVHDRRFESLKMYNPNGICSLNMAGRVVGTNPALLRMTGYSHIDFLNRKLAEVLLFHPSIPEMLDTAHPPSEVQSFETRIQQKRGQVVDVRVTMMPIVVDEEQTGAFAVFEDITSQKHDRQRLLETERLFRIISENSQDIVSYSTPDGYYGYVSPSIEPLLGYHPTEVVGKHVSDFYHPADLVWRSQLTPQLLAGHKLDRLTGRIRHKDGKYRWYETTLKVLRDEHGKAVRIVGVSRDVTERKKTDELLLSSEKLSAVGQLAAGVAHEIRNPLTALRGFTQILRKKSRGSNRRYFEIMQGELDRIGMILNELLILAKPQKVMFLPHNVCEILDEVLELLSAEAILKNVVIDMEAPDELPIIQCEANQLKQVFVNLIRNAIDAMPDGGPLHVRVQAEWTSRVTAESVQIEFVDGGVGIPEDRIPRLGEPFFTTKEQGTGLGLMVSHKIVVAHGGRMDITSQVGVGTTVRITLPASHSGLEAERDALMEVEV